MKKLIESNIWKFYFLSFFGELYFIVPIMVPFFTDMGLSMQQIFIAEASFALTLVLLEIPSGYFADIFGRKTSIILFSIFNSLGLLFFILFQSFWGFVLAEVTLGIGISFFSGAGDALIYDSLLELKREKEYKKLQGNYFFLARIAGVFANIVGAISAVIFLQLPFYLTLLGSLIWWPFALSLTEPKRKKAEFENWNHFKKVIVETIKNPQLIWMIIYSAIPGFLFITNFWLYQQFFGFVGIPIFLFGFILAFLSLASGLGSRYVRQIEAVLTPKGVLIIITLLPALIWLILALVKSPWVIFIIPLVTVLWGVTNPIFNEFIQKMVTSDRRATVISIRSFILRFLFFIIAPMIGAVVDLYTVQTGFLITAALMLVFGGLSLLMLKKVNII